ncbi:MAG TPA: hypothetical protein VFP84_24335 [Kofleriaceae bacterium]|nr:hypothetical protein [Kofleriaceae bacterium]
MTSKQDVEIGRDAIGVVITAGDHNTVEAHVVTSVAPQTDPASVDIAKELAAIRQILATQSSEHANKIGRALDDADEEAVKHDEADKQELGGALDRALRLAKSASGFTEVAAKLMPHVRNTVAWLGERWAALLGYLA